MLLQFPANAASSPIDPPAPAVAVAVTAATAAERIDDVGVVLFVSGWDGFHGNPSQGHVELDPPPPCSGSSGYVLKGTEHQIRT
jgi:hypothetical protein